MLFTVKHITLSDQEFLYQTANINFEPRGLTDGTDCGPSAPRVVLTDNGERLFLGGGTVFVMNENGKTVARYDLGASNVPIVGDGLSDPRPKGPMTKAALAASRMLA